jgi:hypothetical protein
MENLLADVLSEGGGEHGSGSTGIGDGIVRSDHRYLALYLSTPILRH